MRGYIAFFVKQIDSNLPVYDIRTLEQIDRTQLNQEILFANFASAFGAAALVLVSQEAAARLGLSPIAAVESHAFVAGPDVRLHDQPANAILAALKKVNAGVEDLAAVEINEAFAAVAVQSVRTLGISPDIVNTRGGAIALGHPIGASGARIVGTLARQLAEQGSGELGAAGICGGGGQGSALVLRSL